jgi:hypothetical protein
MRAVHEWLELKYKISKSGELQKWRNGNHHEAEGGVRVLITSA